MRSSAGTERLITLIIIIIIINYHRFCTPKAAGQYEKKNMKLEWFNCLLPLQ